MRKPLTRQNSTRDKRRYSAYQNRIFFYLVTLVTAPLLLLGVLSSVVYYRQTVTRSDALLASARENVETQMEIALSNLRAYYSAVVSADNYQTLCQKTVPPYSEYTLVRDMQTAMRGGNLVDKYVEGYTYINLRSGWILSNNGMYRLADAANRDEVAHLLSEWAEQHAAMMWVNCTDQPTPALADTPLNTVDLTGELLVLRSSSYRTGSYAVLIVKLDLSPLYEMTESWQTGGYSIAAQEAWEALRLPEADAPEASGQMLYYQPPDEQCARNGYDTLLEHEITAAVTACKAKGVRHLLERFTAKMLEKNIRGYERQFYIQRLVAAMLAVAENAGLSVNQVLADRQANLFETIGKIYTADQMQNFLMDEVAVPVMDLLTEFRQSSSSELVKNVLALIKQTRGDITLNECADRLNYNPSYIWKVLRTEKDTSFSDLANNEKLEMAKELLLTSDMTVVQIAETLNYSNVQNFIRFFSKKVGMTPGKYRKDYQNEKK